MHDQILDALRRGANSEALGVARSAVEADPGDARAYHLLAMAQRADGDMEAAMATIDHAISLAPQDPALHFQRAGFLVRERDIDQAQQALARTIELDPNLLGAYVLQAELAVGRGDLDEAEQQARVAARIAPDHPALAAIDGMVALRRGDHERALAILSAAQTRAPDDPQVLNALGFAYLANDHLAFAEEAFRRIGALGAGGPALRRLLADVMYRQGRPEDAMAELAPLLGDGTGVPAGLQRAAGELELAARRPDQALRWLRGALAASPGDARTLDLIMQAWRGQGDSADARNTLDAALATAPAVDQLWLARLSLESEAAGRKAFVARWLEALPDSVAAHEAQLALHDADGDAAAAEQMVRRIVELEPGNLAAEGRLLDILMRTDPQAGVRRAEELQRLPREESMKRMLRGWLALANDGAGEFAEAARIWAGLHAEVAGRLIPLPPPGTPRVTPGGPEGEPVSNQAIALLAGLPGSGIEYAARLLEGAAPGFLADRVGASPPQDPLQNINTIPGLAAGSVDPADVAAQWRAALPARGITDDGPVIDWLLWWDNALLKVIGPHLEQARILLTLRDPRDMLLNWLAFGTPVPLRLGTPKEAAQWLADALEHVAVLQEQDLQRHVVVRLDEVVNDPQAMAQMVGEAVGVDLPVPPPGLFQGRRFPAGRWREYAQALGEPFAILAPVAVRLGYPET